MTPPKWYVAYTYPKAEKKVQDQLTRQGVESYLPLHKVSRQWSDRVKILELPLFSCYIFVRTEEMYLPELLSINGISRFIRFENKFTAIKDEHIEMIRKVVAEGQNLVVQTHRFYSGQKVKVFSGPFAGMEGILVMEKGKNRFLLQISGLKQDILIDISRQHLSALNRAALPIA